ncbi:MAG: ATP-binding cassette domain-containing protein [Oscillospiraceae bacterium]|nr:ATP-binding cassette domain-containing protein [Oscillospiraceae bacterium]
MSQINLSEVTKDYKIRIRNNNRSKIADFFRPQYDIKRAVDNVNFSVEPGEMVGYIGPNGAGKSTTIKMLTGILTPTGGQVSVFGRDPCRNRKKNALKMGVVFGQRSQLLWDLPVQDTFELFKTMYKMEQGIFTKQRDRLVEMLDMSGFIAQAVRQLSLGQRMRANLALCFLHQPEVVYLDEPTIGLDVLVKERIRDFLKQINKEQGTTILLTTHDTQDIEQIAERLILIDNGQLLFDGGRESFHKQYQGTEFMIEIEFVNPTAELVHKNFRTHKVEGNRHSYWVPYSKMGRGEAISYVANDHPVADIKVSELGLEDILKNIYAE